MCCGRIYIEVDVSVQRKVARSSDKKQYLVVGLKGRKSEAYVSEAIEVIQVS